MTAPRRRLRTVLVVSNVIVLAAIAVLGPKYVAVEAADEAKACNHEYAIVQAGLRAYMADNGLDTVPATTTNDMTTPVRLYSTTATSANPSFIPTSKTVYAYTWDSTGRVTAISVAGNGPTIPSGCYVLGP